MKVKVKTSAIFYGIVAHDNLTARNNTTYAGKFLKNVIAYLSAGRQALWFSRTCGSVSLRYLLDILRLSLEIPPPPKTETCAIFRLCKAPGAGLAWFTRIRPMLSSLPRGALIPVKPIPQALLHVSIGMCGELKGSCRGEGGVNWWGCWWPIPLPPPLPPPPTCLVFWRSFWNWPCYHCHHS